MNLLFVAIVAPSGCRKLFKKKHLKVRDLLKRKISVMSSKTTFWYLRMRFATLQLLGFGRALDQAV